MNELMITNIDNMPVKSYAIYYTNNERFYVIYTEKQKDENGYVILHIAKVLKEVNSTPEGIVPTGRFIGLEISDAEEWDAVKADIGSIVANKQAGTPTNVKYLPVQEIENVNIKSSKIFKLREDVVNSIIIETKTVEEAPVEVQNPMPNENIAPAVEAPVALEPAAPAEPVSLEPVPTEPVQVESPISLNEFGGVADIPVAQELPAIAPNPFEFQPINVEPIAEEPVVEEEATVNPFAEIQKQREEEMVSALATDEMQDIVPTPFIPVDELESATPVEETPVVPVEPIVPSFAFDNFEQPIEINDQPQQEVAVEVNEPVQITTPEVETSESFVDSIVADVSDIVDNNPEPKTNSISHEIDSRYEKLYKEELEKTIELEKELKELQGKLNNIKNIIE